MFPKRPDKYTTGLINLRNDCFANSSVQAYSSLPGLVRYLNAFLHAYKDIRDCVSARAIVINLTPREKATIGQVRTEGPDSSGIPNIVSEIADNFDVCLHVALAKIISKLQEPQHKSRSISVWSFLHELERMYKAKISRSQHDAHELTQLINETLEMENRCCSVVLESLMKTAPRESLEVLKDITVPEFPFNGLVLSRFQCLQCGNFSRPDISPFSLLTLHPPRSAQTDLESLLVDHETEEISGYHCLKCRLSRFEEQAAGPTFSSNEAMVEQIRTCNSTLMFINDDLPENVESYLSSLETESGRVSSTVLRKTSIIKPPKIFGIHLSRSAFDGVSISRNPCRVKFSDNLTLSISSRFVDDLKQYHGNPNSAFVPRPYLNVLTNNIDDIEDNSGKRGVAEDLYESSTHDSETLSGALFDNIEESDVSTSDDDLDLIGGGRSSKHDDAQFTQEQARKLKFHFRNFNFEENNAYRYKLRSIIRHQGSHTQGHYECFKRKPMFVRDNGGQIMNLSTQVDMAVLSAIDPTVQPPDKEHGHASHDDNSSRSGFRSRISSMIGRRPSVVVANQGQAEIQENYDPSKETPAEVFLNRDDYFLLSTHTKSANNSDQNIRLKKIPSIIKYPYWRIGDTIVNEVPKSSVLFEASTVYILYFERSDNRAQSLAT